MRNINLHKRKKKTSPGFNFPKGKKVSGVVPFFLLGLGALLVFASIAKFGFFYVKFVTFKPPQISCATEGELLEKTQVLGMFFLQVKPGSVESKLKKEFMCIDSVRIVKKLPSKLELAITERRPAAAVTVIRERVLDLDLKNASPSSQSAISILDFDVLQATVSGKFLTDADGFLFADYSDGFSSLPMLFVAGNKLRKGGQVVDNFIGNALKVVGKLNDMSIPFSSVKIEKEFLLVDGEQKLAFGLHKDLNRQLASLQLILSRAKMKSGDSSSKQGPQKIEKIDLRFDKPIVVYGLKK